MKPPLALLAVLVRDSSIGERFEGERAHRAVAGSGESTVKRKVMEAPRGCPCGPEARVPSGRRLGLPCRWPRIVLINTILRVRSKSRIGRCKCIEGSPILEDRASAKGSSRFTKCMTRASRNHGIVWTSRRRRNKNERSALRGPEQGSNRMEAAATHLAVNGVRGARCERSERGVNGSGSSAAASLRCEQRSQSRSRPRPCGSDAVVRHRTPTMVSTQ